MATEPSLAATDVPPTKQLFSAIKPTAAPLGVVSELAYGRACGRRGLSHRQHVALGIVGQARRGRPPWRGAIDRVQGSDVKC